MLSAIISGSVQDYLDAGKDILPYDLTSLQMMTLANRIDLIPIGVHDLHEYDEVLETSDRYNLPVHKFLLDYKLTNMELYYHHMLDGLYTGGIIHPSRDTILNIISNDLVNVVKRMIEHELPRNCIYYSKANSVEMCNILMDYKVRVGDWNPNWSKDIWEYMIGVLKPRKCPIEHAVLKEDHGLLEVILHHNCKDRMHGKYVTQAALLMEDEALLCEKVVYPSITILEKHIEFALRHSEYYYLTTALSAVDNKIAWDYILQHDNRDFKGIMNYYKPNGIVKYPPYIERVKRLGHISPIEANPDVPEIILPLIISGKTIPSSLFHESCVEFFRTPKRYLRRCDYAKSYRLFDGGGPMYYRYYPDLVVRSLRMGQNGQLRQVEIEMDTVAHLPMKKYLLRLIQKYIANEAR